MVSINNDPHNTGTGGSSAPGGIVHGNVDPSIRRELEAEFGRRGQDMGVTPLPQGTVLVRIRKTGEIVKANPMHEYHGSLYEPFNIDDLPESDASYTAVRRLYEDATRRAPPLVRQADKELAIDQIAEQRSLNTHVKNLNADLERENAALSGELQRHQQQLKLNAALKAELAAVTGAPAPEETSATPVAPTEIFG